MDNQVIIVLLISIASVICIAAAMYIIIQKKLKTQVAKLNHEMQNLRYESTTKTAQTEFAYYEQISGTEVVIYNSGNNILQNDFTGQGARAWDYVTHKFLDEAGSGSHDINVNTVIINRTNTAGRYELHLKHYSFGNITDKIPADSSIRVRRLRISCEVKKGASSHILRFVFKGETSQNVLDEKDYVVFSPEWEQVNLVFTVSAQESSYLRIDDLSVLAAPSHIHIRNIVLYEKK